MGYECGSIEDMKLGALILYDYVKRLGKTASRCLGDCIGILVEGEFNLDDFRALKRREVINLRY